MISLEERNDFSSQNEESPQLFEEEELVVEQRKEEEKRINKILKDNDEKNVQSQGTSSWTFFLLWEMNPFCLGLIERLHTPA